MNDRQSAAILIGAAVVWFLIWYRQRDEEERSHLFGVGEPGTTATKGEAALNPTGTPLDRLLAFAKAHGLTVTSTTGGRHNAGSLHYMGRAIDVRSRTLTEQMVEDIKRFAAAAGIRVLDERKRPPGQLVWGGPHLHLEVPR